MFWINTVSKEGEDIKVIINFVSSSKIPTDLIADLWFISFGVDSLKTKKELIEN